MRQRRGIAFDRLPLWQADDVLFSGLIDDSMGAGVAGTMVSVRDVYRSVRVERGTQSSAHGSPPPRQLPVRRQAFCSDSAARSALERCRRAIILVSLAHPSIHFTLQARSTEHTGDRVVLDAPKVSRRTCDAGGVQRRDAEKGQGFIIAAKV